MNRSLAMARGTSGSMSGQKIDLLKEAVKFIIRELTDKDRLCLVIFNSSAQRLCPLTVMSAAGKEKLCAIMDRVHADGGTAISTGLHYALQVLKGRRHVNNVPSILLLSDGQDGAPAAVRAMDVPYVLHSFGFGGDHDALLLGNIAEKAQGTFTFVEKFEVSISSLFSRPSPKTTFSSFCTNRTFQIPLPLVWEVLPASLPSGSSSH